MIEEVIEKFEVEHRAEVLYVTMYGSKLFGTDNENSDTDYKGIFLPSKEDVLLKRDIEHFNYNTNAKGKNEREDIDLQLYSIYKWFNLLKKGETGALDLLFSLFREETQIFTNQQFTSVMKENYQRFYNRNLHSFIGYCVGQSKLYNIKGERFNELHTFVTYLSHIERKNGLKLETLFDEIETIFREESFKYIRFTVGAISRGDHSYREGKYVEVLGKKFSGSVTVNYFFEHILEMENQFGNRARSSAKGVDFKALSHAVRVINEVEELLDEGRITFPLKNRAYIVSIKEGRENLEDVMHYIDTKLDLVQEKLEESTLPEKSDEAFIDSLILSLLQ